MMIYRTLLTPAMLAVAVCLSTLSIPSASASQAGETDNAPVEVVVTASVLNVRRGPDTEYPVKFQLLEGTRIVVINRADDWAQIRDRRDRTGWVAARYTQTRAN